MDKWLLQAKDTILDRKKNPISSYYYTRELTGYFSHIFLVFLDHQDMLENSWEWIEEYVAFHFQSRIEKDIEMSNFYICYFIKEEVDLPLQKKIEQGTYCAKKYVFSNVDLPVEDACAIVENKIFALALRNSKKKPIAKISKISIANFRKYKGIKTFLLQDNKGNPASFTLIYAPNGSGKTSFTDGVEYLLKGEVTRLKELADLTNAKGMIYHNYDCPDEAGFVELVLSGKKEEKIVRRKVGTVKNNKTDIWRCPPANGRDLLGNDPTKWNLLILPHDKVDSFLTATTPAARYKEWFDRAPDLANERAAFEKLYTEYQELKKKQKGLQKGAKGRPGIEELTQKVAQLEASAENARYFLTQIKVYNEAVLDEQDRIALPEDSFSLEEYKQILSQSRNLQKKFIQQKDDLESQLHELQDIKEFGTAELDHLYHAMTKFISQKENTDQQFDYILQSAGAVPLSFSSENSFGFLTETNLYSLLQSLAKIEEPFLLSEQLALQNEIQELEQQLTRLQEMQKSSDDTLETLQKEMHTYLLEHNDLCECPVCHSNFSTWNALMKQVEGHTEEKTLKYQRERQQIDEKLAKLREHFHTNYEKRNQMYRWRHRDLEVTDECSFPLDNADAFRDKVLAIIDHEIKYIKQQPYWSLCLKYHGKTKWELDELYLQILEQRFKIRKMLMLLNGIQEDEGIREYLTSYQSHKALLRKLLGEQKKTEETLAIKEHDLDKGRKKLAKALKTYFQQDTINKIYQKLDPHDVMKNMAYRIEFKDNIPQLFIKMNAENGEEKEGYQPEMYFSTAQLNTVAFSSFLGRAIEESKLPIRTIFIDDPIDNFDDMNMLGFADLLRCIIENTDCQIVMTTHDPKVLGVMERKLDKEYHSSCFITL